MLDRLTQLIMLCVIAALIPAAYAMQRAFVEGSAIAASPDVPCDLIDAFIEQQQAYGFRTVVFKSDVSAYFGDDMRGGGIGQLDLGQYGSIVRNHAQPVDLKRCGIQTDLTIDLMGEHPAQPYIPEEDSHTAQFLLGRTILSTDGATALMEYQVQMNEGRYQCFVIPPHILRADRVAGVWTFTDVSQKWHF